MFLNFLKRRKTITNKAIKHNITLSAQYKPRSLYIPKRYYKKVPIKDYPLISIVTPSFNHGLYIEETIKSVIDQKYPNLEYIVNDGGSTDNTTEILKKYSSDQLRWTSEKDKGQADAINRGLQSSKGEIMAYLNSDDLLLPGSLNYIAKYFQAHPSVDVVYSHRVLIDKESKEIGRWILPLHNDKVLCIADYVPQETMFWRRSIWEKAGSYIDDSFDFAIDWEILLRFIDEGAKFRRLPKFLGAFRVHNESKSKSMIVSSGHKEMSRLRFRHHKCELTRREIRKKLASFYRQQLCLNALYQLKILRY